MAFKGQCTVPRGSTVHAAAVTFDLTEGRRPAVLAVTVLVTVTHLTETDRSVWDTDTS